MTPYHREMANSLLDSMYGQLVDAIATSRKLEPAAVRTTIDGGPATPAELQAAGLVDDTQFLDELRATLVGADGKLLDAEDYAAARRPLPGAPAGAPAHGGGLRRRHRHHRRERVDARATARGTMGSDTLVEAFQDAAEDDGVAAIIFRDRQSGRLGAGLGSDLARRTRRARRSR